MSTTLFYFFYTQLWNFTRIILPVFANFSSKLHAGIEMRKPKDGVYPWLSQKLVNPVWFHCASGEFEYAKPVIREFKKKYPNQKILLTYFSPSVRDNVALFKEIDFACPTPWENPKMWQDFIAHHQPQALLIARTDVWPEMLRQCEQNHIPSLLFSASLTEKSGRMKPWVRWLTRLAHQKLNQIFCVSADDQMQFIKLGLEHKTKIQGDTRFDQVFARLAQPKKLPFDWQPPKSETERVRLVLGSTWPEDEAFLLPLFPHLLSQKLEIVLVPHEPSEEHIKSLSQKLSEMQIPFQLSSEPAKSASVLLVDQVGFLAELYVDADLAFVGGSFRKLVHSVMEPLACGCVTFVGPFFQNNREAQLFMKMQLNPHLFAVQAISQAEQLQSALAHWLALDRTSQSKLRDAIQHRVRANQGATQSTIDWLTALH